LYRPGGLEYLLFNQTVGSGIDPLSCLGLKPAVSNNGTASPVGDDPAKAAVIRGNNAAQQERERLHRIKIGKDTPEDHWLGYVEPCLQLDTLNLLRKRKGRDSGLPKMGDPQKAYLKAIRSRPNLPEREGTHLAILFHHIIDHDADRRAWATLRHFIEVGGHRWLTDRLVNAHLKMVPPRVFRSRHTARDNWDCLVGAGNEGLLIAVANYDYRQGYQFGSYAQRSIVSAVKDAEQELRSTVHRPDDYWRSLEDEDAVFDASLNFDLGDGRTLSGIFSHGDGALPPPDGGKHKKIYPLRGATNRWTPLSANHCKRMQVWIDALEADKTTRRFIGEWRTVYGGAGFEYLCRSRLTSSPSRLWTLWQPKPRLWTLIASHTETTRAVWGPGDHFDPGFHYTSEEIAETFLAPFVDRSATYYQRLNAAIHAARGGMTGFFAGAGGDMHDAPGYSGDFKDGFGLIKKKKRGAVEEHQAVDDWERPTPRKQWKIEFNNQGKTENGSSKKTTISDRRNGRSRYKMPSTQ
jgi:hypothetical protein